MTQRDLAADPLGSWRGVHVVVGGQFGSEGKGAFVAALHHRLREEGQAVMGIRVGGPNAGHTAWAGGQPYKWQQLPAFAAAALGEDLLVIGPGSEVDEDQLRLELIWMQQSPFHGGRRLPRVLIDRSATLMLPEDADLEQAHGIQGRLGSTAHGIGEARVRRIRRLADTMGTAHGGSRAPVPALDLPLGDCREELEEFLSSGGSVIVEGTQGAGLSLHSPYYPFTTSWDCDATTALAAAGVPAGRWRTFVWVVFRRWPIRVAGNSGPLRGETTWEALHQPPEYTTVTGRLRRVGGWDPDLAELARRMNGGWSPVCRPVLMMADHGDGGLVRAGESFDPSQGSAPFAGLQSAYFLDRVIADCGNLPFAFLGTSPWTGIWRV